MSWLDTLLGNISQARSTLGDQTGGAQAPSAGAPAAAAAAPPSGLAALAALPKGQQRALQQIAALPPAQRAKLQALHDSLATFGQNGPAPKAGGGLASAVDHFGGKVLGYGNRPDAAPGGAGRFADVLKGGQLFHIYDDPSKNMKMDTGQVAGDLGVKPKQGALEVVHPSATPHASRAGAHVDPATGGVQAPGSSPMAGFGSQGPIAPSPLHTQVDHFPHVAPSSASGTAQPLSDYRRALLQHLGIIPA